MTITHQVRCDYTRGLRTCINTAPLEFPGFQVPPSWVTVLHAPGGHLCPEHAGWAKHGDRVH